ncbi:MAG: serine/threonine protein kinase [Pirellulales bacterium]|nr:serine/threonine protein kinase [Pirellulales bacterium]
MLGEGNLCRVYSARPIERIGKLRRAAYVVKVLQKQWEKEPCAIRILHREAAVGMAVSHPNVVPVLAAASNYLVMPRLAGQTLAAALGAGWRPAIPVALWIARQVALGLSAIQTTCGMIHGDVKPSNIFLAPNGHATLIDLGFARTFLECRAVADLMILGTLRYAAPETVSSILAADHRADLYSLGVTLYEMFTGVVPLDAKDPGELARMQRQERPPCIRTRRADLPKPIAALVHTLLDKDPLRRIQSFSETIDRLVRLEIEWFAKRDAS